MRVIQSNLCVQRNGRDAQTESSSLQKSVRCAVVITAPGKRCSKQHVAMRNIILATGSRVRESDTSFGFAQPSQPK